MKIKKIDFKKKKKKKKKKVRLIKSIWGISWD